MLQTQPKVDETNTLFHLAVQLVQNTGQHLFLTGKAGTGKTTFLRHITANSTKNTVVVAPTGVAAINAGGVTMHSFFQLPRGAFVPGIMQRDGFMGYVEITDKHTLFKNIHFSANKRKLLQELELLIIDEVSMLRCDMLDAMDTILRHFRKAPQAPFGGVQVLYIGDLYQLPPVVGNEEWKILSQYYQSPFFFSAHAVQEAQPLYIELKKIYRQTEQPFITLLNNVRNNTVGAADMQQLAALYQPQFSPAADAGFITITTHNQKADAINEAALARLSQTLHTFTATIKDDFGEKSLPTDFELKLKEGAQVMFVKNDSNPLRRYFNGKLATVKEITPDGITVSFRDGSDDLLLEQETWKNIRYIYNKENDEIDEEVLGSFTQYPIRLAWAITVHKSQGLTFDKAVIDAGSAFAAGQVYVALSRCTTLNGLVLKSKILPHCITTDARILSFAQQEADLPKLKAVLQSEGLRYQHQSWMRLFSFRPLMQQVQQWQRQSKDKNRPLPWQHTADAVLAALSELDVVAQKFGKQLNVLVQREDEQERDAAIIVRVQKAITYFSDALVQNVLLPLFELSASTTAKPTRTDGVTDLQEAVWGWVSKLCRIAFNGKTLGNLETYRQYNPAVQQALQKKSSSRPKKGDSQQTTLQLFQEGFDVEAIAGMRGLAQSTVESHLASFVKTGVIEITRLVPDANKLKNILQLIEQNGDSHLQTIKSQLGEEYTWGDVRFVVAYYQRQEAIKASV